MSHIPAHAMPHAAPHHHDAPPADAPQPAEAMTIEPTATAAPIAAIESDSAPGQQGGAVMGKTAPSRTGWGTTALAAGGVALIAGLVTVGVPFLRRRDAR